MTRTWIFIALWMLIPPLYAEAVIDEQGCVRDIKEVCRGLDHSLDLCLKERSSQLKEACRQVLQTALIMSQSPDGAGDCVKDMRQFCGGLEQQALADCIDQKRTNFSERCRSYLDTAPNP